jgi:DNA-binding response OmpR family regulator
MEQQNNPVTPSSMHSDLSGMHLHGIVPTVGFYPSPFQPRATSTHTVATHVVHLLLITPQYSPLDPIPFVLQAAGHQVSVAGDGQVGLKRLAADPTLEVVFIEVGQNAPNGFATCAVLRECSMVPIILVSDSRQIDDIVEGFALGADDYLARPFTSRELTARLDAVLRRAKRRSGTGLRGSIQIDELVLDQYNSAVRVGNRAVSLSPTEARVLNYLVQKRDQPVSKKELTQAVWGEHEDWLIDMEQLRLVIWRLRRKIEAEPASPRYLRTLSGWGYQLCTV